MARKRRQLAAVYIHLRRFLEYFPSRRSEKKNTKPRALGGDILQAKLQMRTITGMGCSYTRPTSTERNQQDAKHGLPASPQPSSKNNEKQSGLTITILSTNGQREREAEAHSRRSRNKQVAVGCQEKADTRVAREREDGQDHCTLFSLSPTIDAVDSFGRRSFFSPSEAQLVRKNTHRSTRREKTGKAIDLL